MSRQEKRTLIALLALALAAGGIVLAFKVSSAAQEEAAQEAGGEGVPPGPEPKVQEPIAREDVGRFRWGSAAAKERAGLSGLPLVYVFTSPQDANWFAVRECLVMAEASGALEGYTAVLIDSSDPSEDALEQRARENGLQVLIRLLVGKFQGGLDRGFLCGDLIELLESARSSVTMPPQPSPLLTQLRRDPSVIDWLVEKRGREGAEKIARFFREIDGDTEAVRDVEARLTQ